MNEMTDPFQTKAQGEKKKIREGSQYFSPCKPVINLEGNRL